ncbi:MAG: hypothetical protein R3B48_09460 [Kofleriaceae bacterium]
MGLEQILRAAAVVAVVAAAAPAQAGAPVVVVDLTEGSGAAVRAQLRDAGLAVMSAPDLDAVTAGTDGGADLGVALAALAAEREAFGALDCAAVARAASDAVLALAARAAAGIDARASLVTAWSYLLLCQDRAGELDAAMRTAAALHALLGPGGAAAPPTNIDAAVWDRYPAVDATPNRVVVELIVESEPGATVELDHRPIGVSPVRTFVPAGPHLVASGAGSRRAARWIELDAPTRVELPLVEQDAPLSRLSERVATWKARPPDGADVSAFLENLLTAAQGQPWNPSSARSPLLVVIGLGGDARRAQLWASDGPGLVPTATEHSIDPEDASSLIAAARTRGSAWRDATPEPPPLLVETERPSRAAPPKTQWWVYAALAGALAVGAAAIYVNETAQDTQRVELRWP